MKTNRVLYVSILMIAALVLTACGAAATDEAPAAVETDAPEAMATEAMIVVVSEDCAIEAPAEPVTINFFGWTYPLADIYADEIAKCNGENLEINVQLLGNQEVRDAVDLALAGGADSPYDIIHSANASITGWADQGFLLPLDDLIDKYRDEYDLDDIASGAWAGATYEGKIYGVPIAGNTKHIAYRTDLFEQYGLDVPTTYDEVIAACGVLAEEASIDIPFTMNLHAGWAWAYQFRNMASSYGMPYLVNDDNTPAFNSEAGIAAGDKIKEVIDACMNGAEGSGYSIDDSQTGMATGGLAFVQIWASRGAGMVDGSLGDLGDVIAFAPAAASEAGNLLAGGSWNDFYTIPATSSVDPDLAFRVIMEAADAQSQALAAVQGIISRTSVEQQVPNGAAAAATIAGGVGALSTNPAGNLAQTALGNWLPFIGDGSMTSQEALDAAAEEYILEAIAQGYLEE